MIASFMLFPSETTYLFPEMDRPSLTEPCNVMNGKTQLPHMYCNIPTTGFSGRIPNPEPHRLFRPSCDEHMWCHQELIVIFFYMLYAFYYVTKLTTMVGGYRLIIMKDAVINLELVNW